MKRIKLFEAFNNGGKIAKVNHLLLCWCVKEFIKHEKLESQISAKHYTLYYYIPYFDYNFDHDWLTTYCDDQLNNFITSFIPSFNPIYKIVKTKNAATKEVIKKMYEDEKNKAI